MKRTLTLTLTENCNLSCIYCYERHHVGKSMIFDTAQNILDKEFAELNDSDEMYVEFFGGEPFLEFELIKQIVEYVNTCKRSGKYKAKYCFFASSNGTLVHGEVQEWLSSNKNFYVGLSLDGNKIMQDINRCNSFDNIDIDFFLNMYPTQPIKMTISNLTLKYLAEGIIFAHNKGFRIECNLAYNIDWHNKFYKDTLVQQLDKLIAYYVNNPEIERASILNRNISMIGYTQNSNSKTIRKYCGTGTAMHTYYVDGLRYPCQFFMPISCGVEKAKTVWQIVFDDLIPLERLQEKCKNCIARQCCPTCYGANYVSTGDIYTKDPNLCELEKIVFYANACLAVKQWDAGCLSVSPVTKFNATLFGARQIIETFGDEILN